MQLTAIQFIVAVLVYERFDLNIGARGGQGFQKQLFKQQSNTQPGGATITSGWTF